MDCVSRLIQMGADVNECTAATFRYPLISAVSTFRPNEASDDTVELLLKHGADPNVQNQWKSTALHVAAARSTPKAVQMLVEYGANVAAVDNEGETAACRAHLQTFSAQEQIMESLGGNGATAYTDPKDYEMSPAPARKDD